jgi:oxygen-independent coproporphyrinogen-3 oxidase
VTYDPYKALYVHIPFCVKRCGYCDFVTRALPQDSPLIDEYLENLVLEIRRASKEGKLAHLDTIYIGGGTPTHLGISRLSSLLYALSLSIHFHEEMECTLEANPESITEPLIRDAWALGVNRLSVGVQSFDVEVLQTLGRAHSADDARHAIETAQTRFENVSLDLMAGIPGQTLESFEESVQEAVRLGVKHISVYPLTIEPHTPFDQAILAGRMAAPDDDVEAEALERARRILEAAGFHRYEVANYALPGFESKHNTAYWTGLPYLGLGTSAVTMTQNSQRRMRVQDGQVIDDLNTYQMAAEDLMLGMRRACGVPKARIQEASLLLPGVYHTFENLEALGLVEQTETAYKPTDLGWLCGNELYGRLLDLAP